MPRVLSGPEVDARLAELDGWKREGKFITKSVEFGEYMQGIEFVNRVAEVAEEEEHHPDIHIRYTRVTLAVQTHSEGGVTAWDLELAEAIEKMMKKAAREHGRARRG